jgi:hypothetical protein
MWFADRSPPLIDVLSPNDWLQCAHLCAKISHRSIFGKHTALGLLFLALLSSELSLGHLSIYVTRSKLGFVLGLALFLASFAIA